MPVSFLKDTPDYSKSFIIISIILYMDNVNAEDLFDINAINTGIESQVADVNNLGYLSYSGGQLPGIYYTDIFINQNLVDSQNIKFIFDEKRKELIPQLNKGMLLNWGVKNTASKHFANKNNNEIITNLDKLIPSAKIHYSFSDNQLDINIPQIGLENTSRGYIEPSEWDNGINAAFVNYTARYNKYWYRERDNNDNTFLGLRSGINFDVWRLRNHSNYTSNNIGEMRWNNLQTYLERDIRALKSHLTLGETSSDSGIMESNPYLGIKLTSDESMLPQSQRGFAPVVMGIAQSNATVTVKQNGSVIYQTTVPPGEFSINDLYPTSYSGDLDVTIEEADGTIRSLIQPFSAVPMMQRTGALKYSIDIGKYNASNARRQPKFFQISLTYGLPCNLSIYGGVILSPDYQAYTLGSGISLGNIGALSMDVTESSAKLIDNTKANGQSYRIQYSKHITGTGTSFSLASYRYSTKDYYDFSTSNNDFYHLGRKKQQFQVSLSQSFKDFGYLSLNGYQQYYWDKNGTDKNLTMSFSSNYKLVSYSASYTYSKQNYTKTNDQIISLNLSIPFDWKQKNTWINYSYTSSRHGDSSSSLSYSSSLLENDNLQYDITQRYNHNSNEYNNSVSANYIISSGEYSAGYNYTQNYHSVDVGMTGALVLHADGITASQSIYDSAVLVKAQGIENLKVNNTQALYTDASGFAVIPSVTRYERNKINVDAATLTGNNDIAVSTTTVVPTQGAIVLADFHAKRGARVLLKIMHKDKPISFGTQISIFENKQQISSGIAANDGKVYLSGIPAQSQIVVKWGTKENQYCEIPLSLSLENEKIQFIEKNCD